MPRHYKYNHWISDDQQAAMSHAGVMAREFVRQSREDQRFTVIPQGLQLANIIVDLRYEQEGFYHALLFQHGSYHNRYKMVLNNKVYPKLIGWDDGSRIAADCIVPISKSLLMEI
jgi:hypothetical protein